MRRGTTPTFAFEVDTDLTGWDVYVSFGRAGKATHTEKPIKVQALSGANRGASPNYTTVIHAFGTL